MLDEGLVYWERYPRVAGHKSARAWLQIQANLMLAPNTIDTREPRGAWDGGCVFFPFRRA
jgi:hypothetical protein